MNTLSTSTETVRIDLADRSYDIVIGENLLGQHASYTDLPKASSALIVKGHYKHIHTVHLPDGEAHKDWVTLNLIFDTLLGKACDRKTVLFALGGGVVGDMAGFAAASFMRGVPFVQIATTLLAQVESSVGGKTAINHPMGKNMIGAFYQPQRVICDLAVLKTLPPSELSAGLAEIIKYGPIFDMAFFDWIEANIEPLKACNAMAMAHAVKRSCEIKAEVVGQDEREAGLRAILNFGHTFGHAIEAGLGYGKWLHGEAVGCGMVMASHLSEALGLIDASFVTRFTRLLDRAGLPIKGPVLDAKDNAGKYLALMLHDKKSVAGDIQFVLIEGPGRARVSQAPEAMVREVIDRCCA